MNKILHKLHGDPIKNEELLSKLGGARPTRNEVEAIGGSRYVFWLYTSKRLWWATLALVAGIFLNLVASHYLRSWAGNPITGTWESDRGSPAVVLMLLGSIPLIKALMVDQGSKGRKFADQWEKENGPLPRRDKKTHRIVMPEVKS